MKDTHVWALLVVCATVVALGITGCQFHTTRTAMQHNYCEVQDVGQRGRHWSKCDSGGLDGVIRGLDGLLEAK